VPLKLQVRDLLLVAFIVFALTGLVRGWGTGYIIAAAALLALLSLTAKARLKEPPKTADSRRT
jgi:hypothetical protein